MNDIEFLVLQNLATNEKFTRRISPYLKESYFSNENYRWIYKIFSAYFKKYNKVPTIKVLEIETQHSTKIGEKTYNWIVENKDRFFKDSTDDFDWIMEKTEEWIKDTEMTMAVRKAVSILDGKDKKYNRSAIPTLLSNALSVSFDEKLAHNLVEDAGDRYDYFNRAVAKVPTNLQSLNYATGGGLERKKLVGFAAQSHGGKSAMMVSLTAGFILDGLNVLYISLELESEVIANRIDASILDMTMKDVKNLTKQVFCDKIKNKTKGILQIRDYGANSIHCGHIKALLSEFEIKKNFKPDVICIDYLGILASEILKPEQRSDSYNYMKSVAEEMRNLAKETNTVVITAMQLQRGGYDNTEASATNLAGSIGIMDTLDLYINMIRTPELKQAGNVLLKQEKNRLENMMLQEKFLVGFDPDKMKFYDLQNSNLNSNTPNNQQPKPQQSKQLPSTKKLVFNGVKA